MQLSQLLSHLKVAPLFDFDSAAVIGVKGRAPDEGLSLSNPCISSQHRSFCPVTSQGTGLSPNTQAISVRNGHGRCAAHLRTRGCTSRVEGADVVVSTASCLFSVLFPFCALCLVLLVKKEETEALFMLPRPLVESSVQICQSVSLSPWCGADHCTSLLTF